MIDFFLGFITFLLIVLAVVMVIILIEVRRGIKTVEESVHKAEKEAVPVLKQVELSLQSVRQITERVATVAEDVQVFSGSVRQVGQNVKQISDAFEELAESSAISASGLKVGVKTALIYLAQNWSKRKKTY